MTEVLSLKLPKFNFILIPLIFFQPNFAYNLFLLTLIRLAILAKNLPQSAKIQHHAQTLPANCWT